MSGTSSNVVGRAMSIQLEAKQRELLLMHLRMAQQLVEELYSADEVHLAHAHLQSAMRVLSQVASGVIASGSFGREEIEPVAAAPRGVPSVAVVEPPTATAATAACASEPALEQPPAPAAEAAPAPVVKPMAERAEVEAKAKRASRAPVETPVAPAAPATPKAGVEPVAGGATTKSDRRADAFSQRGVRNEAFAHADNLAEVRRKSLASIASALTINDRRYYANELCSGDKEAFASLVAQLDALPSLAHSVDLLQRHYSGSADNPALQEFIALLERRFS